MPATFTQVTVGSVLKGKQDSMFSRRLSWKSFSSNSQRVTRVVSLVFSPIWMRVPGGRPAFFDLFLMSLGTLAPRLPDMPKLFDGFVKSPSAALRLIFGKGAG